ncbi:MAG TPA: acyl carrier protein [Streptosporangiaceae bacterium]|nr:acyl carrier protein [Streptosporangiaceae bacterium]
MWDEGFEATVRKFLPFLPAEEPLDDDTPLRDLGLDSLGAVELLSVLESQYHTRFVDSALSIESFATAGVLWHTLGAMIAREG